MNNQQPYYEKNGITIYNDDCLKVMRAMENELIDLTVTSPPYSTIRNYKGYVFDFESTAKELYRITKKGGVVVWIVGDKTKNGTEELVPFSQALFFKDVGFCVETMIYSKPNCPFPANVRYNQQFEFMFILSKGIPKTFNPIKVLKSEKEIEKIKNKQVQSDSKSFRNKDGATIRADSNSAMLNRLKKAGHNIEKTKGNVWEYPSGYMISTKDKVAFQHPAIFPEQLAKDHIISWSNEGDLVYDPLMGSGTTLKVAAKNNRNCIGNDTSKEYCDIAVKRLEEA